MRVGRVGVRLAAVPVAALAALIKAKLARPQLAKADWVAFAVAGRT